MQAANTSGNNLTYLNAFRQQREIPTHRKRCCVTSNAWPSEKTCIAAQPIKRYSHLMKMAKRLPILVSIKWKISATDSNNTTSRPRLFGPQMDLNSQTHLKQEVSNRHHPSITNLFQSEFSWSIYYRNFSTEEIVVGFSRRMLSSFRTSGWVGTSKQWTRCHQ